MKVKVIEKAVELRPFVSLNDEGMTKIIGGSTICSPYSQTPCMWYYTCGTRPEQLAVFSAGDNYYSSDGSECIGFYSWTEWCIIARNV
jgi:hypothetical protein